MLIWKIVQKLSTPNVYQCCRVVILVTWGDKNSKKKYEAMYYILGFIVLFLCSSCQQVYLFKGFFSVSVGGRQNVKHTIIYEYNEVFSATDENIE